MKREIISEALGNIDDRHITQSERPPRRTEVLWRGALAAVLILALIGGAAALLSPPRGVAVTAYAHYDGRELTSAGAGLTTGHIDLNGVLTGHPLMFHLDGERIASVRFSCRNEFLEFTDMTDTRNGFGYARNFTVDYGEDESQYPFLVIDWIPTGLIDCLRTGEYGSFADLPAEYREDVIVMEVTGIDGGKAVKAVTVRLRDDGSFFASFDDYEITADDDFLTREDARPIPEEVSYGTPYLDVEFVGARDDAGWIIAESVEEIRVTWQGRQPEKVEMYYTPTGTEMLEYTQLLATKVPAWDDTFAAFPQSALEGDLMGHVWFVAVYDGSTTATTDIYNVFTEASFN